MQFRKGSFPLVPNHRISVVQANQIWEELEKALRQVQNGNASQYRFEALYRNAYVLVLNRYSDMLHNGVAEVVTSKMETVAAKVAASPSVLESLVQEWEEHRSIMVLIGDIMMYMVGSSFDSHIFHLVM